MSNIFIEFIIYFFLQGAHYGYPLRNTIFSPAHIGRFNLQISGRSASSIVRQEVLAIWRKARKNVGRFKLRVLCFGYTDFHLSRMLRLWDRPSWRLAVLRAPRGTGFVMGWKNSLESKICERRTP